MELLFLFIALPFFLGVFIAFGLSAVTFVGLAIVTILLLAVRFWYITLAIMAILLLPIVILIPWVGSVFTLLACFAIVLAFIPIDEKKRQFSRLD